MAQRSAFAGAIAVGVDGTERSRDAVVLARTLAQATGANLLVASVHPSLSALAGHSEAREYETAWRKQARARLADVEPLLEGLPSCDRRVIPAGSPASGLQRLADQESAELIVVGSTHRGALGRVLVGSVGERLLSGARCAVAVAPRGFAKASPPPPRLLGVAIDGSAESAAALRAASALARAAGAELRVITVVEPFAALGDPLISPRPDTAALTLELLQARRRQLDAALAQLPSDVAAEGMLLEGDAAQELGEQSRALDLLVTGSRGYGPPLSVLLGSVTSDLARVAACPLLVVPRAGPPGSAASGEHTGSAPASP